MDTLLINSVRILRLTGSRAERARQHGEFVRAQGAETKKAIAFTPLSKKNQTLIKRATDHLPGVGRVLSWVYEAFVLSRFFRLPKTFRDRLEPFAKVSGLSLKTVWLSLYQPDFLMLLASISGERARKKFVEGMPGCTTLVVENGGHHYFLRNLDYPAAGYWEKLPTVYYHEPSEAGLQKYVSISSLGIDTSGLTGCNESGIAFSLHAHFAKKVSLKGVPIFFLGELILERATTLAEAIAIAESFKTIGSWALNLTSFKEGLSICLELSNGKVKRRDSKNGVLAHANDFQAAEFQEDAVHFNTSVFEDSTSRKSSLDRMGEKLHLDFTWPKALASLGSHYDAITHELRVFGNAPSVVTTIQSVAFDPKEKCLYISHRSETPTGHGPYLKLPLSFADLKAPYQTVQAELNYDENFKKALHLYHDAYVSWQVKGEDAQVARALLTEARTHLPDDPHLLMQLGFFELKSGDPGLANLAFEQALKQKLATNLRNVAHYFLGTTFDLVGKREDAILAYQAVLEGQNVDLSLAKKARHRLKRPFAAHQAKFIAPDLQFAEPLDYR